MNIDMNSKLFTFWSGFMLRYKLGIREKNNFKWELKFHKLLSLTTLSSNSNRKQAVYLWCIIHWQSTCKQAFVLENLQKRCSNRQHSIFSHKTPLNYFPKFKAKIVHSDLFHQSRTLSWHKTKTWWTWMLLLDQRLGDKFLESLLKKNLLSTSILKWN